MKRNKYIFGMMTAALLAVSCSDFSDYNESYTSGIPESNLSLWQNIEANQDQLSQFMELVQKTGFDKQLAGNQYYTVWAPVNGTFDEIYQQYKDKSADTILLRFVQNHIANASHVASGDFTERVFALNEKTFMFQTEDGTTKLGDNKLNLVNLPSRNGVLHLMSGAMAYLPNVYEYIFDASDVDSVQQFLGKYEKQVLNEKKSTPGDINDEGNMEYLDSVFDVTNSMTRTLRAYVEREDSNYSVMLPTNKAYADAYARIKPYFNYVSAVPFKRYNNRVLSDASQSVDADALSDSLTRMAIANSIFFNNNLKYNRWTQNVEAEPRDTLVTTNNGVLCNGNEFLDPSNVIEQTTLSNGVAYLLDSLPVRDWEMFSPQVGFTPTSSTYRFRTSSMTPKTITVRKGALNKKYNFPPLETYIRYLDCLVADDYAVPSADFFVPGTASTTYNVYVVMVPADIDSATVLTNTLRPYKFKVTMGFSDANGSWKEQTFVNPADNSVNFYSDVEKIDTVCVGQITFPVAYRGITPNRSEDKVCATMHIESTRAPLSFTGEWARFDNHLRIGTVILRPVAYDEHLPLLEPKKEETEAEEE